MKRVIAMTTGVLLVGVGLVLAGPPPAYRYGEMWWDEYPADPGTELLLHFGPPTATAHAKVGETVKAKKAEERVFDDLLVAPGKEARVEDGKPALAGSRDGLPPVDETRFAAGTVADVFVVLR